MSSEKGNKSFSSDAGCGDEAWLDPWECLSRLDSFRKALMGFCRIKTLHGLGETSESFSVGLGMWLHSEDGSRLSGRAGKIPDNLMDLWLLHPQEMCKP